MPTAAASAVLWRRGAGSAQVEWASEEEWVPEASARVESAPAEWALGM